MGRGPSTFKQKDLTRTIKAALAAGVNVSRVELGTGTITVSVEARERNIREPQAQISAAAEFTTKT